MTWKWFVSRTVRHAGRMARHVQKLVHAQRDLLRPEAIAAVEQGIADLRGRLRAGASNAELVEEMNRLEQTANKWLKPYPHPSLRENFEVFLVAIAVAMGIRTFFLQPFKIPTGSMQPTLYGITSNPDFLRYRDFPRDLRPQPDFEIPNRLTRLFLFWYKGVSYVHVVAKEDGRLTAYQPPRRFLLFNLWQRFRVGDRWYRVWFPQDDVCMRGGLINRDGQFNPRVFRKGEDIIKMKIIAGDHLFVDRLTYNFRHPKRGEIIVFETRGISGLPQDQYYIKRLVALGGERVRIGNDRHLIINGKRLDASTPHFEKVYSFDPRRPPRESQYSGHVNNYVARIHGLPPLAPKFPDENAVFQVPSGHYLVMGDNTLNSSDSRYWGSFPRTNVIGKSFMVYWPFGAPNGREPRFGWGHR